MIDFLRGGIVVASLSLALFFVKFYRRSADRLFLFFALSFVLLGANYLGLMLVPEHHESRSWVFAIRLAAFSVLIVGILDKNRNARRCG